MSFDIVTYCSHNYKDALNFVLPSWLGKSGCDNIWIYTDGFETEWSQNERIEICDDFEKSDSWVENVGRLPWAAYNYFHKESRLRRKKDFCLMGVDCLATGDWLEAFEGTNWITCTREKKPVNIFWAKNCEKTLYFINAWLGLSNFYRANNQYVEPYYAAYDQKSFGHLIKLCDGVRWLNKNIWANEENNLEQWLDNVRAHKNKIKMLHFKGRRWHDKELIEKILNIIK